MNLYERKYYMNVKWKIYFWFLVVIVVNGYSSMFSAYLIFYDYLDIPFSILGLVGLFGYAYKKKLLCPNIWKICFFLIVIWEIFNTFFIPFHANRELVGQNEEFYVKFISLFIALPLYISLFLYGFRSKEIWQVKKN